MPYTLEDLEKARADLKRESERDYRGNNPNKGRATLRHAVTMVSIIEGELKMLGLLEKSDREKLADELDKHFPDSKSKQIVTHNGKRYQLRFYPAEKSLSGKTVNRWDRWWEALKD